MTTIYASSCVYFAASVVYYENEYSSNIVSACSLLPAIPAYGQDGDVQKAQSWIFSTTLTINVSDSLLPTFNYSTERSIDIGHRCGGVVENVRSVAK